MKRKDAFAAEGRLDIHPFRGDIQTCIIPGFTMRPVIALLILINLGSCAIAAEAAARPRLSFSLTATNGYFVRDIGEGFRLRVDRDELGWEVGVFKNRKGDNLLLPRGNWHGAQMCQIYTWMPRDGTFGNDRVIPIQGSKRAVRIRLVGATASGKPGSGKFTGGSVDLYLEP